MPENTTTTQTQNGGTQNGGQTTTQTTTTQTGGANAAGGQSQSGQTQQGASGTEGGQSQTSTQSQTQDGGTKPSGATEGTEGAVGGKQGASGETIVKTDATTQTQAPPTWEADWRQKAAGTNAELLKLAERYTSPNDLLAALDNAQKKIASSSVKQPLPKDATPEQLAAYRKENGIPETVDKYDLTLPDGLVIGEADKPIVDNMLKTMHGMNLPNDTVKGILASYYQQEKAYNINRENEIASNKQKMEDNLRTEWGGEYRGEINRIENLLNTYSPETQSALQFGLDDKGMPLLNNPHVLKDLAVLSRQLNPVTTIVPAGDGGTSVSVDTEIAQIEKRMADDRDGYFKDDKMQARYRELQTWKENNKPRKS